MNSMLAPHSAARIPTGKSSWFTWAALPPDARAPSWGKTTGPSLAWKCRATCLYEAWTLSIFAESGMDQRWEDCLQMWGPGKFPWQLWMILGAIEGSTSNNRNWISSHLVASGTDYIWFQEINVTSSLSVNKTDNICMVLKSLRYTYLLSHCVLITVKGLRWLYSFYKWFSQGPRACNWQHSSHCCRSQRGSPTSHLSCVMCPLSPICVCCI